MSDKVWGDAAIVYHWWDEGDVLVIEHRENCMHSSSEDWRMTGDFALRLYELLRSVVGGDD